jgi:hypothetical protein
VTAPTSKEDEMSTMDPDRPAPDDEQEEDDAAQTLGPDTEQTLGPDVDFPLGADVEED